VLVEIRFRPSGRAVRVAPGATLLEAARAAGLPVGRACGGDLLCGRCACTVLSDRTGLPQESPAERRTKARNRVAPERRLACALRPQRDVEVTASGW